MVTAKSGHIWTRDKFIQDFKESTCYMPPLKLEDAGSETFLETRLALVQLDHILDIDLKSERGFGRTATIVEISSLLQLYSKKNERGSGSERMFS